MSLFWSLILIIAAIYVGISFLRRFFKEFKRRKELREFLRAITPKITVLPEFDKNDPAAWMKNCARAMGYETLEEIEDKEDEEENEKEN